MAVTCGQLFDELLFFYRSPVIVYFCVFLVYQDTVYKAESQKEEESPIRR